MTLDEFSASGTEPQSAAAVQNAWTARDLENAPDRAVALATYPIRIVLLREVIFLRILTHHAVGSELWDQGGHSATYPLNPLPWDSALVTIVEHRHHFLRQDLL
jgi:hypothetical protein